MRKSKFNLSYLNSTTGNAGYLIPFFLQPTLPNDTFRISLTSFIRAQPMLAPLMHEVKFFTQYWFVPYRIIWDEWEEFITGGSDLEYAPEVPSLPAGTEFESGSLGDYFGYPINVDCGGISVLPFRAYNEIWNNRYRDEDLQGEQNITYTSGADNFTSRNLLSPSWKRDYFTTARPFTQRGSDISVPVYPTDSAIVYHRHGYNFGIEYWGQGFNQNPNVKIWFEQEDNTGSPDFDGSTKSWSELIRTSVTYGNATAYIPAFVALACGQAGKFDYPSKTENQGVSRITYDGIGDNKPLLNYSGTFKWKKINTTPLETVDITCYIEVVNFPMTISWNFISDSVGTGSSWQFTDDDYISAWSNLSLTETADSFNPGNYPNAYHQTKQWSQLQNLPFYFQASGSGIVQIRDLRAASALQRYGERSLQWGNRYEEFIQREFGIKPRDSRIQRPEYLGGGKGTLQISEVLQTAEGADTGVGTMRGHGVAGIGQRPIKFRSPEHGLIIGLLSIRPVPVYTQGVNREFLKRSRLDFFTPELANIGMQEVLQRELYVTAGNADTIFGYSDRYQEYRYNMPKVTGEFRTTLNFWNMARQFEAAPVLNSSFINMSSSEAAFYRPFASQTTHQFLMMLRNNVRAYRPIPKRAKNILK